MNNLPQYSLHLEQLEEGMPGITPRYGAALAEAGAICLDEQHSMMGVKLQITGEFNTTFLINWSDVTEQMRRCWNDSEYTTEQAAYGVACLLIERLTSYTVIERSRKGTGFDYWIGHVNDIDLPFQNMARLEVSGIRRGNQRDIKARMRKKVEQVKRSNSLAIPAYIMIVEFSTPIVWVEKR